MIDPREITREAATALGKEAVAISSAGRYTAPSGAVVEIAHLVAHAREHTTSHPPDEHIALPGIVDPHRVTRVAVRNETTLVAANRLVDAGLNPAALNFAAARSPGGGFLTGARAQEESLCRASALYACLVGNPMYEHHFQHRDALYSSWTLYSPDVPVFREDDGVLLETPWTCAFITAAAPNARVLLERRSEHRGEIADAMAARIERVLGIAARAGHRSLVLGAWGCGAFGCDAEMVAGHFESARAGPFHGVFDDVVSAVLDTSVEIRFAILSPCRSKGPHRTVRAYREDS